MDRMHPIEEAQKVRGLCARAGESHDIQWRDLEVMGYTPLSVLKAVENAHTLLMNRRAICEQNTKYVEQYRRLEAQYAKMRSDIKRAVKALP